MPFGYLEFSRAKRRDLCPHVRAPPLAAAGRRSGSGSGSGSGLGLGLGSLPGLVLFESGPKGPLPPTVANLLDCQRLRTRPAPANGCVPVGLPTVANQPVDCQRLQTNWTANSHDCWVERLQSFVWVRTCWPLLEGYIKGSKFSIKHTTTTPNFRINSLSL